MYTRFVGRLTDDTFSLDEIKNHLIVHHSDDDALLAMYRDAAIEHVQDVTRRTLFLSMFNVSAEYCGEPISLRLPPVRTIYQITYDYNGEKVTLTTGEFTSDSKYEYGRIEIKSNIPLGTQLNVRIASGYGDIPATEGFPYQFPVVLGTQNDRLPIPTPMKLAVFMLVAHWYEHREAVGPTMAKVPTSVDTLLFRYRNYNI